MSTVVKVENLGKKYFIGAKEAKRDTLREVIMDTMRAPFQRFKKLNANRNDNNFIWALKGVSFDVKEGDVIGIIGRNGAGKTTLLKIISKITEPTEGCIKIKGRVSSLLEVGTGFHQELTGRENIYLNGAVLGMKRAEINQKFDEIVEFSEIEKFLDTPVKRYSSGMYVRLAFAVAAHLEPEILIVDEVLAVGDAAFQKKCLGKMKDVGKRGRTVLFVSHNMATMKSLCQIGIHLQQGQMINFGKAQEIAEKYELTILSSISREDLPPGVIYFNRMVNKEDYDILEISLLDNNGKPIINPRTFDSLKVKMKFYSNTVQKNGSVVLFFHNIAGVTMLRCATRPDSILDLDFKQGINEIICNIEKIPLPAGTYILGFGLAIPMRQWLFLRQELCSIDIGMRDLQNSGFPPLESHAAAVAKYNWELLT
jgi:lipopolysaccharide transport system ATP-binding protein